MKCFYKCLKGGAAALFVDLEQLMGMIMITTKSGRKSKKDWEWNIVLH
jgi:hypothetical protein